MAATAAAAPPAAAPLPPPAPAPATPPPVPEQCKHKNRLQEFSQRTHQKLPIYHAETEGQQHQLKFRCTVQVGSERFSSARSYSRLKEAEQDAARVAYEILVKREEGVVVTDVFGLIDQDVVFCKSILHEFAVKTKTTQPTYSVVNPEGLGPMILFVASVLFDGNTYTGEVAKSKKDAEQKAARAVIKSILGTKNACMLQIIRSKKKLITAITSSGYNKERGAVSQQTHNTPTNTPPPISTMNFTPPVGYEAYVTPQFAYTYGISPGTSMQPPLKVQVLNVAEPLQGGPTHMPVSQVGSSYPIAVQGPNIIPAPTHLMPASQAGSASSIAVQEPNIIPAPIHSAPIHLVPVSQAGSASPIAVQGPNIMPAPTNLVPVSQAGSVCPIAVQGPKIIPAVDPSANPSAQAVTGSKKRKKNRIRGPEATEERVAEY